MAPFRPQGISSERSSGRSRASGAAAPASERSQKPESTGKHFRSVLPLLKDLVRPRRGKLALGFLLMLINRPAGLVLPGSTKYLVDSVIMKHQTWMLQPLVLLVLAATLIQGVTSFILTQLLSKEAQRLIAELRHKVSTQGTRLFSMKQVYGPLGVFRLRGPLSTAGS